VDPNIDPFRTDPRYDRLYDKLVGHCIAQRTAGLTQKK
jgi:hypothetical protein